MESVTLQRTLQMAITSRVLMLRWQYGWQNLKPGDTLSERYQHLVPLMSAN
jgi:hypothetical protein